VFEAKNKFLPTYIYAIIMRSEKLRYRLGELLEKMNKGSN